MSTGNSKYVVVGVAGSIQRFLPNVHVARSNFSFGPRIIHRGVLLYGTNFGLWMVENHFLF